MQIHELVSLEGPDASGNVLAIDTGVKTYKITWSDLAKAIVESYDGSTLNGSAQTVASALGGLATDITTATSTLTSDISTLDANKMGILTSTSTAVALDDLPLNSAGRVSLSATDAPLGSSAIYNYICFGISSRKTIIVSRPENLTCWVKYKTSSTNWSPWINELSGGLCMQTPVELTTSDLTTGAPYSNLGGCWYYKTGTRVHVHFACTDLTADTNNTVYQMPTGYRPYKTICAGGRGSTGTVHGCIYITGGSGSSSGKVTLRAETGNICAADIEYDAFY